MADTTLNKSFFYDYEKGWGNRSYFTFFSEFNRPWSGLPYLEAVIYMILFFISMCVNILIIYQIVNTKSIRTVTNCFICNLALADIFFTLTSPLIAAQRIVETWVLGEFICHVMVFALFVSGFVITWTMTMISIDRYICINRPSSKKITRRMSLVFIAVIWVGAFSLSSPVAMYFVVRTFPLGSRNIQICTLVWPVLEIRISVIFTVILCVLGFIIPLIILGINYFLILKRFCKSRRTVANIRRNNTHTYKRNRENRDFKVIQTLILVVLLFLLMWLPIFIVFVMIQMDGMEDKMKMSSQTFIATLAFTVCNACVNPFIYGMRNYRIKRAILKCVRCNKRNKRRINTDLGNQNQTVYALSYSQNSSSVY